MCNTIVGYASKAAERGSVCIADEASYRKCVIDPAWEIMPAPIRLLGRDRLKWDSIFSAARSKLFVIEGEAVSVHPDAKKRLDKIFSMMLQIEKPVRATPIPSGDDTFTENTSSLACPDDGDA